MAQAELITCGHYLSQLLYPPIIEGTVEVLIGESWQTLQKGEGIQFKANQVHGYRNSSKKNVYIHNIIHYPVK